MKLLAWLVFAAALAVILYGVARWRRRSEELQRASEARMSTFLAEARAAKPDPAAAAIAAQRLLFDAAAKAGQAGEPVLAIQLYARLLARYPESALAEQARAAVEAQKKNLNKA